LPTARIKAILFDIEGTLLEHDDAVFLRFPAAIRAVFGVDADINKVLVHGMTDKGVMISLCKAAGINRAAVESNHAKLVAAEEAYVAAHVSEWPGPLLGVRALLANLQARRIRLGLVTGNPARIARIRLDAVGLADYFMFGGYGDYVEDRARIVEAVMQQVRRMRIRPEQVAYFGDTPHDIAGGKMFRVITIGVATGIFTKSDLESAGADETLADLSDTKRVLTMLKL
jgi:phosphoglycolate phosphatase-like HAD superfamily hydrolase